MYLAVLVEITVDEYQWLLMQAKSLGYFKEQEGQPKPSARQVAAKLLNKSISQMMTEEYTKINKALDASIEYRQTERHNL